MPLYIATRSWTREDFASAKTRQEKREIGDRLNAEFAADLQRAFPEVKIAQRLKSINTLFLELPEEGHIELARRIAGKLGCSIVENRLYT